MKDVVNKLIYIFKSILIGITCIFMLIVFSPLVITDKETYSTVKVLSEAYSDIYTNPGGLDYAIVMRCAIDTADDFIASYNNEDIIKSKKYQIESGVVELWKQIDYQGKDKTLRNVSEAMKQFSYAPAKASSDIKMIFNNKLIIGWINAKALMYTLRYDDPIIYTMFKMLSVLTVLGSVYISFWWNRDLDDEYNDEDYEDYGEAFDGVEYDEEEFEEKIRNRRI